MENQISLKKVTARGKRYVYVRSTGECIVSGFKGSEAELRKMAQAKLGQPLKWRRLPRSLEFPWRMDAARMIHRVTGGRAKHRGQSYDLTAETIFEMLTRAKDRCAVTGLQFDYGPKTEQAWTRRPMSPSLDRIDNAKGYERSNLRLVCVCVNIAIGEWGFQNFEMMCRAFVERNPVRKPAIAHNINIVRRELAERGVVVG